MKNTKLFLFLFKIMPYLDKETKTVIFYKIDDYYHQGNINEGHLKFIIYYKDN